MISVGKRIEEHEHLDDLRYTFTNFWIVNDHIVLLLLRNESEKLDHEDQ